MRTRIGSCLTISYALIFVSLVVVLLSNTASEAAGAAYTASCDLLRANEPEKLLSKTTIPTAGERSAISKPQTNTSCGTDTAYTYELEFDAPYVPADTLIPGTQCDDCSVYDYPLPFPVTFFGTTFNTAQIGSNGLLSFTEIYIGYYYTSICLANQQARWSHVVLPFWNDWDLRLTPDLGVYSKLEGVAPHREFTLEWRACRYSPDLRCHSDTHATFQVRFYEGSASHPFDFIYAAPLQATQNSVAGVIRGWPNATDFPTQYGECGEYPFFPGLKVKWFQPDCLVTPVPTATPTATPTPQPPRCPDERFTDVCPGDYFYAATLALNEAAIVSGYETSPPCETNLHVPCFKPFNDVTRGQISKIISLAENFSDPAISQRFEDFPPSHTFYYHIDRLAANSVVEGYACGGPGEPCVPPNNRPYFRAGNLVTRAQLSKMISIAFEFSEPVSGQIYEDIPPGSTFYEYVQRLAARSIINGYECGPVEPCVPPYNRPYFRPGNSAARGQTVKMVYLAISPVTPTPTSSSTGTPTNTLTPIPTLTAPPQL